jgi:cystathionine beta-lyase/cystathionine gamma-synthase
LRSLLNGARSEPRKESPWLRGIGIEHIDDIIADIERGLNAAGKLAKAA